MHTNDESKRAADDIRALRAAMAAGRIPADAWEMAS